MLVPANLRCRRLVLEGVRAGCELAAEERGVVTPERVVQQLTTAAGEAFNNIVIHGHAAAPQSARSPGSARPAPRCREIVQVEVCRIDDDLWVTMCDHGSGFDIDAVPAPDLGALPESGMGLFLIRAVVDELRYSAGRPNVLRFRKRMRGEHGT